MPATPSTDDLVAAFLAKGGTVKKIAEGERAMDPRAMRIACGYEPDSVLVFECLLIGEDGQEFMVHETGGRKADVEAKLARSYPEARVRSIEPKGSRDKRLYHEAMRDDWQ